MLGLGMLTVGANGFEGSARLFFIPSGQEQFRIGLFTNRSVRVPTPNPLGLPTHIGPNCGGPKFLRFQKKVTRCVYMQADVLDISTAGHCQSLDFTVALSSVSLLEAQRSFCLLNATVLIAVD